LQRTTAGAGREEQRHLGTLYAEALHNSGAKPDDPLLIHSNINQVRGLFETWDDAALLRCFNKTGKGVLLESIELLFSGPGEKRAVSSPYE
jgi:hypothetical protein